MRKLRKYLRRRQDFKLTERLWRHLNKVDLDTSEYLFVFNHVDSDYADKLYSLAAHYLAKHNIASTFLYQNAHAAKYLPPIVIEGKTLNNSLTVHQKRGLGTAIGQSPFFNWEIDIAKDRIVAQGINFFDMINTTLRKIQKRYNVNYQDDALQPNYKDLIESCDILLKTFSLFKQFALTRKLAIRFVGWEVNYIPNGVLRLLCDHYAEKADMDFIEMERGYVSYFGHSIKDSFVCCANLTRTQVPFHWVVNQGEYENLHKEDSNKEAIRQTVASVIDKYKQGKATKSHAILNLAGDYRNRGRSVFVLFAHLFYDTPVNDRSHEFADMCDWLLTTIQIFKDSQDLLIIKPHPVEVRKDHPKKLPNETVASYLANESLGDNIVLLAADHLDINDLKPFISCGLIWRSSVAMELTYLGIPCIIAGRPYYELLNLNFARSKSEYAQMIEMAGTLKVEDRLKSDIARYLHIQKLKNVYIDCIEYDNNQRKFKWDRKALKSYLQGGDKSLERLIAKAF